MIQDIAWSRLRPIVTEAGLNTSSSLRLVWFLICWRVTSLFTISFGSRLVSCMVAFDWFFNWWCLGLRNNKRSIKSRSIINKITRPITSNQPSGTEEWIHIQGSITRQHIRNQPSWTHEPTHTTNLERWDLSLLQASLGQKQDNRIKHQYELEDLRKVFKIMVAHYKISKILWILRFNWGTIDCCGQ